MSGTPTCGSGGSPNVVALSNPNYYVDFSQTPRLDSNYAGYILRAGATSVINPRLRLSGFTGGSIELAPGQEPSIALPTVPAGGTHTSYFLLQALALTAAPQTHTITVLSGVTEVCQRTFTFNRVADTIRANANKVISVNAGGGAVASLGDVVTVTAHGETGVLGAGPNFDPGILSYAPTAFSNFPASAWRLERTEMLISPDGSAPAQTYVDRLFLAGASGPNRTYTAKYTFRAVGPSPSSAGVVPVQYIASGTQVKHTSTPATALGALPQVASDSSLSLSKAVNVTEFPLDDGDPTGGTVTYTVVASNTGGSSGTLDEIIDVLPAGVTLSAKSARVNNRFTEPVVTGTVAGGQTLTWYGPFSVPAGGQLRVTYDVEIPAVAGTYTNSVTARYGAQVIDASKDLDTDTPATATVTVAGASGGGGAGSLMVPALTATTSAGNSVTVPSSDPNITISALPSSPLNGEATLANGIVTYTPNSGFVGVDEFDYIGTDGTDTGVGTITITVASVDLIARPDVFVKGSDTLVIPAPGVLANDQCPTGTSCIVSAIGTLPSGITLSPDGAVTYSGIATISFDYELTTAEGVTTSATVEFIVADLPALFLTTSYNTSITQPLDRINNVRDFDYGSGSRVNNQSVTYTPPPNASQNSNKGFWGIDRFRYSRGGGDAPVRVLVAPPTLTIAAQVGQPVARSLTNETFLAAQEAREEFIVNCPGCLFEVSTSAQHGVFSLNSNTGDFTYLPDAGTTATSDMVVVKITDMASPADDNMFVFGTINFTISEFVEVVANDDSFALLAGDSGTFNVATNDRCPDGCEVEWDAVLTEVSGQVDTGAFTFTAGATIGAQTFTYTLRSTKSSSVTDAATVTVNVEGTVSDSTTTAPGQTVTVPVLDNDPCHTLDGVNCELHAVTGVAVGAATISDTSIQYTPPEWFAGATTFTYVVHATNGSTSSAQVTVNVLEAVDDSFTVSSNVPTIFDPLANDLCVDCRITSVTGGDATIVDEGFGLQVTASATTNVTYEITDASGATSSAMVSLTVAHPPVAVADEVTTSAGVAVAIDVLANDQRTAGGACTVDCSAEVFSDPADGSVSLRADGALQYTPRADFAGVDTFTYLIINDFGLTDTATVTINVDPVANPDAYTLGTSLNNQTLSVMDNDLCASCTLSVGAVSGTGVDAISVDGTKIRVTTSATTGVATVAYTLTAGALTTTATVTLTVNNASPDAATTSAGTAVIIDVIANDTLGDTTVSATSDPGAAVGSSAFADREVTFTPAANFSGLAQFTYTTEDSTSATVSVLVAPTTVSVTTVAGVSVSGIALMPQACLDCEVTVVAGSDAGDLEPLGDGTFRFTPDPDFDGTDDALRYEIHHLATGLRVTGAVEVTVNAPVAALTAGLELTTSITSAGTEVGDIATVTYTVTNSGTATVSAVTLIDPTVTSVLTCPASHPITELLSGATVTCTATFTLTQAHIDAGSVTSVASVSASSAVVSVDDPAPVSASSTLTLAGAAALEFTKTAAVDVSAAPADQLRVGNQIIFTFTVTNSGPTTVSNVLVTDPLLGLTNLPCPDSSSLAPGGVRTCSATLTITQAHLDAGGVTNSATVGATALGGRVNPQVQDTVFVPLAVVPSVTISATIPVDPEVVLGETVPVVYDIVNNGPVALENLTVVVSSGTITCAGSGTGLIAALAVGDSHLCTGVHTIVQADIDITLFSHGATVSGLTAAGLEATASTSVVVPFTTAQSGSHNTSPPPGTPAPPPAAPQINDDNLSAPMGAIVTVQPLNNDGGSNLQITAITPPNVGFAQLAGNTVTLTPPLFHVGPISLTYTATDGQNTGTARITITMTDTGALLLPEMFLDLDRNGRRDPGEPGIAQVQMQLTLTARAQLVAQPDGSLRLTRMTTSASTGSVGLMATATGGCVTDPGGVCVPPSMPAGSYVLTVAFDPEVHGLEMTAAPTGTIGLTSGIDLTGLEDIRPAFGFAGPGTIAATVDPDEWVEVVWAGPDGEFDTDDDVVVLVRGDANGQVIVPGLPNGRYVLRAPRVAGTTPAVGERVINAEVNGVALVQVDARLLTNARRLPTVGADPGRLVWWSMFAAALGAVLMLLSVGGSRRRRVEVS